ncbi:hypothetical protein EJ08DRAFT_702341 [Tothia fuscella]|uniref:DUF7708 domain-containing protein n=1 Tax=Tothia fuscella TaxID=1048955 RepID=A0A9P4NGH4_9PEZI|nr:hypothetical protein EJ08DRAFT_702341 [Tothia fuscella]
MQFISDAIPLPSEQPLEVDYLQNRQRIFSSSTVSFDVKKQQFVPLQPRQSQMAGSSIGAAVVATSCSPLLAASISFGNAVKELQAKRGSKFKIANFSLEGTHSWEEIKKIIDSAEEGYLKEESASGKIRKVLRKVGDNGKSIQSFLGILPDGSYKTLCGGLTLILTALIRNADIRDMISNVLDEMPDVVIDCKEYLAIYAHEMELRSRVGELYIDVLAAFEDILRWYNERTTKHFIDSFLQNTTYKESLEIRIQRISRSRSLFKDSTDRFLHWRLSHTHKIATETNNTTRETNFLVKSELALHAVHMNQLMEILGEQKKKPKWLRTIVDAPSSDGETSNGEKEDRPDKELAKRSNKTVHTPESLASALKLRLHGDEHVGDVKDIQCAGLNAKAKFRRRSIWLAKTPEFQRWFNSRKSWTLCVQGSGEIESISPVSLVSALLYTKLSGIDRVMVLPFFCGRHSAGYSKGRGPLILIKSLLEQILSSDGINWAHGAAGHPYLLLSRLQSQYDAIFIVLDGLDYYDCNWLAEVRQLIDGLTELVKSDKVNGAVKLFLGAATHVNSFRGAEGRVSHVVMPNEIDTEADDIEELE